MIVIEVELHSARTKEVTLLGKAAICNTGGTVSAKRGNYGIAVFRRGTKKSVARVGNIENWPRLTYNVWRLVIRLLLEAFPEEKRRGAR